MPRWVVKLQLNVAAVDVVPGPDGQPVPKPLEQFQFETRAEEPGEDAVDAVGVVQDRLDHWAMMLASTPSAGKES